MNEHSLQRTERRAAKRGQTWNFAFDDKLARKAWSRLILRWAQRESRRPEYSECAQTTEAKEDE
jgi:hypothetical protein